MAQVYGGDEVNAVVLDSGAAWTRSGWAGDDGPKTTVLSSYTSVVKDAETAERMRKFGDDDVYLVRGDAAEVYNPLEDSVVKDWEAAEELWSYSLASLAPDGKPSLEYLEDKPLMITEQTWSAKESTAKSLQWALESANARATYISKVPVCALFGAGKPTGLVIDIGLQTVAVTPVIDGLTLHKPARHSQRAGAYLNQQIARKLNEKLPEGVSVKPYYETTNATLPEGITETFRNFQLERVYDDVKERMVQVKTEQGTPAPDDDDAIRDIDFSAGSGLPSLQFTSAERYELGASIVEGDGGLSSLVIESIKACDVDARANLVNNIVIVGGTSLVQGLTERLNHDISRAFPMLKVRIYASGNTLERRNGAWIGGSLLASLGTFHQLWVSKPEYDEIGAEQLVERRFR